MGVVVIAADDEAKLENDTGTEGEPVSEEPSDEVGTAVGDNCELGDEEGARDVEIDEEGVREQPVREIRRPVRMKEGLYPAKRAQD